MKKLFSLLFVALLATSTWAATEVTFTPSTVTGTTTDNAAGDEMSSNDVTITCDVAAFGRTDNYRFYANSTATISTAVGKITKIVITCTASGDNNYGPGNSTYTTGTYTVDGSTGTWEGEEESVTFSTTKQIRATKIVVTVDEGGTPVEHVDAPVFNPETGTKFIGSQTVSLTCATDGATIYYTTDSVYQEYTGAFTITETSTIKAKAVKGELESSVATAKYYRMVEVSTLAQANALDNNTDFIFYGNPIVTYRNGSYTFVKDETAYGLIYGNQVPETVVTGCTLGEDWDAVYTLYKGYVHEYTKPNNVTNSGEELVEIVPTEYAEADLTTDNINERVIIKGVSIVKDGNNYFTADGMQLYNQFGITMPADLDGKTFDVEGMVTYYSALQLYPIEINLAGGTPIVTCAAPTLPESQNFTDSFEVTITNNEEGATVYYALNNGEYQEYTGAFTVTETTTVKAYATISGVNSEEVTATYTKVEPAVEQTFALVTNAADLADGDQIILVSAGVAGDAYAMGAANKNNFGHAAVTITEDLTITTADANVVTLEAQEGGNWAMKVAEGYLYAPGGGNYLRAKEEIENLSIASIAIDDESAAATIIFVNAESRNYLRYNENAANNNPLFSCYNEESSVMTPAYIFKVKGDEPVGLRGDVDLSGDVSIDDVTALIDYLLMGTEAPATADCDLSGDVSIDDVTCLIDYLLTGNWPE